MKQNRCAHCGRLFDPNPRVKNQSYCGNQECRKARRRRWRKWKLATDPDYKANQKDSQKTWQENNPDYWQKYRERNPEYAERNRNRQRERRSVVKIDASEMNFPLESGTYYVIPESADVAKIDASTRKVRLIPVT